MDKIIEIEGKKYKLTPMDDEELLDSFGSFTSPQETQTHPEEPMEFVKAEPKIKSPKEMMMETAKRITEARVKRITLNARTREEYNAKVGRDVANSKFFYGEGAADFTGGEEEI